MSDILVGSWKIVTGYLEESSDLIHHIKGNFEISSRTMSPGIYSITVIFIIKQSGETYAYRDTIEYEIIGYRSFDIFNLLLATIGTFGGLPLIWRFINRPKIRISDLKVMRWQKVWNVPKYDDFGNIIGAEDIEANTVLQWKVNNDVKWKIFRKDIQDLKTRYSFSKVDLEPWEKYTWSSDTPTWPLLGAGDDHPQRIAFETYCIPNGEYVLNLNIMSGNNVLCAYRESLTVNEETLRKWRKIK